MFNKSFCPYTVKPCVQNPRVEIYTCVLAYKEMAVLKISSLIFFQNLQYYDVLCYNLFHLTASIFMGNGQITSFMIYFFFFWVPFQGCLPLVLMFDMKEEIEVEPQFITQLMEQLDVFISIKPKPKQPSKVGEKLIYSF